MNLSFNNLPAQRPMLHNHKQENKQSKNVLPSNDKDYISRMSDRTV
jgi:hypothetical protein